MNELILKLERLTDKSKGITNLLFALEQAGETEMLDNFNEGLSFLVSAFIKNNAEIEKVWKEMHKLEKANYISK